MSKVPVSRRKASLFFRLTSALRPASMASFLERAPIASTALCNSLSSEYHRCLSDWSHLNTYYLYGNSIHTGCRVKCQLTRKNGPRLAGRHELLGLIPDPSRPGDRGVTDFNNDDKPDILWRNTATGANSIWWMDGITATAYAVPTASLTRPWRWQDRGTITKHTAPTHDHRPERRSISGLGIAPGTCSSSFPFL